MQKQVAVCIGHDIARDLSLNLSINGEDTDINIGGIILNTTDKIKGIVSLRNSF